MAARPAPRRPVPFAAAAALLLAACGSLDTPDVTTGEVTGRLSSVKGADARVYVLGQPELGSAVAGDGSYRIAGVPAGPATKLVFYDGGPAGQGRAEVVTTEVRGATRVSVNKGDEMPLAATVVVLPRAWGGCKSEGAEVRLEGSDHRNRKYENGRWELFPVPEGTWNIEGALKGFKPKKVQRVVSGGTVEPVELVIDEQDLDSPDRGCLGATCAEGLTCDPDDGRCYACVSRGGGDDSGDLACGAGAKCEDNACVAVGADRDDCEPCTSDEQCGAGGVCVPSGDSGGHCATAPSSSPGDQPCDSGFAVATLDGRAVCAPPYYRPEWNNMKDACATLLTTFGSPCLNEDACKYLEGGLCRKSGSGATDSGECTAPCQKDSDCPNHVGFRSCTAGYCSAEH
jgi:hypothetical protein